MEDLQLVLFVLGAIAIIAVLVHGFWSIRRQQPKSLRDSPIGSFYKDQADRRDAEGFDADGIGQVRVRKPGQQEPEADVDLAVRAGMQSPDFSLSATPGTKAQTKPAKPRQAASPTANASAVEEASESATQSQMELGLAKDNLQAQLFDEPAIEPTDAQVRETTGVDAAAQAEEDELGEPQDVLVLHLMAKEGEELQGAELLPCLLTLNFKFGEMNIFHRHVDNAGTGKVLFSMANMVKPGTFDPDNMEQFSTPGVVLFMTMPCYGDALMNFSIMLNSAHQLADDLDALVLDAQRQPWDEASKQDYLRRIRAQVG
ncbi:cell division protein ZipA [Shewanella sp. AS16]|uniref:cell division protein ZipA n=1 Tax=Shewanella sp. AS16 TaxID=2907625 RepID=UPI001F1F577C|nr:cell division protein ZipA [Shewanella sp. AS16]MCE9686906.1 cell division protein ZipA [Shewanella sp. AS16]